MIADMKAVRGTLFAAGFVLAGLGHAAAQDVPKPESFDKQELTAFVESQQAIGEEARQWEQRIQQADNEQQARQLEQQARQAYVEVVRDNGLSVERYNEIFLSAKQHESLQERLQSIRSDLDG